MVASGAPGIDAVPMLSCTWNLEREKAGGDVGNITENSILGQSLHNVGFGPGGRASGSRVDIHGQNTTVERSVEKAVTFLINGNNAGGAVAWGCNDNCHSSGVPVHMRGIRLADN